VFGEDDCDDDDEEEDLCVAVLVLFVVAAAAAAAAVVVDPVAKPPVATLPWSTRNWWQDYCFVVATANDCWRTQLERRLRELIPGNEDSLQH